MPRPQPLDAPPLAVCLALADAYLSGVTAAHPEKWDSTAEIAAIRKALKSLPGCEKLSVRRGRGTAGGYVDIRGSGQWGEFAAYEHAALSTIRLPHCQNHAAIEPDSRPYWGAYLQSLAGDADVREHLYMLLTRIDGGSLRWCGECGWMMGEEEPRYNDGSTPCCTHCGTEL